MLDGIPVDAYRNREHDAFNYAAYSSDSLIPFKGPLPDTGRIRSCNSPSHYRPVRRSRSFTVFLDPSGPQISCMQQSEWNFQVNPPIKLPRTGGSTLGGLAKATTTLWDSSSRTFTTLGARKEVPTTSWEYHFHSARFHCFYNYQEANFI